MRYALEKNALLAYQVNGQELEAATGSSLQLWMPETVARYFTRDIVNIELTQEDAEPDVQQVDPCYRNKINIMNYSDDCVFKAGDEITFEGVADDLGSPIAAIEFSFDNGRTWTSCDTDGATADKWANWQFTTSFEEKGDYRMTVRAKTADGHGVPACGDAAVRCAGGLRPRDDGGAAAHHKRHLPLLHRADQHHPVHAVGEHTENLFWIMRH